MSDAQRQIETTIAKQPEINLLGMDRAALEDYFESIGEKKFRATQSEKRNFVRLR